MKRERLAISEYNHLSSVLKNNKISISEVTHIIGEERDHLNKDLPRLLKRVSNKS